MNQQIQTLDFFSSHADDWQSKATTEHFSTIENRHNAVLESMKAFPKHSSLLDVGCGTGQLAIQASLLGWDSVGIDFSQEMINKCVLNNEQKDGGAKFICSSIFDYKAVPSSVDVVSAQGLIEYLSLDQLDEFIGLVSYVLKNRGLVAVGSRNRLFNLHTLNEFTDLESELETIDQLLREGRILQEAITQENALEQLRQLEFEYSQPSNHPNTGIGVNTRYQFTPADLATRLCKHGLHATRIFPVHYHPFPITLMSRQKFNILHQEIAKYVSDELITFHNLVPYSSSFVIEARKIT